jgi:hypothetical protein
LDKEETAASSQVACFHWQMISMIRHPRLQGGSKMEKEKEILTLEEIEEIIRKLEVDYPELVNPRQTEQSDKAGAE